MLLLVLHLFFCLSLLFIKFYCWIYGFYLACVAAITSLKQQVEALENLDQSVEILVRLLCALPGWSEKNVQVFTGFPFYIGRFIFLFRCFFILFFWLLVYSLVILPPFFLVKVSCFLLIENLWIYLCLCFHIILKEEKTTKPFNKQCRFSSRLLKLSLT